MGHHGGSCFPKLLNDTPIESQIYKKEKHCRNFERSKKATLCPNKSLYSSDLQSNFILNSNSSLQSCLSTKTTSLTKTKISKSHDLLYNKSLFVLLGNMKGVEKSCRQSLLKSLVL